MEIDLVNDTITPITDKTFKKQKWEKYLAYKLLYGDDADGEHLRSISQECKNSTL